MADDSDTPSEMYVEYIEVWEWDDFYEQFGYLPGQELDDDEIDTGEDFA